MKLCCIKCEKYSKFKRLRISYILNEVLVFSSTYAKCHSKNNKMFKEEEYIEKLNIIGLIYNSNHYYIFSQM